MTWGRSWKYAHALAVVLLVAACVPPIPKPLPTDPHSEIARTDTPSETVQIELPPNEHDGVHDVPPVLHERTERVTEAGAKISFEGVEVLVPEGAVADGDEVIVRTGPAQGLVAGLFLEEEYGKPVSVDHGLEFGAPVVVEWEAASLQDMTDRVIVMVRWDDLNQAWEATDRVATVSDGKLRFESSEFSVWTWIQVKADSINQVFGRLSGARAADPECFSALPDWAGNFVGPGDLPGMPLKACVEGDGQSRVRVRLVNNRPYAQIVRFDVPVVRGQASPQLAVSDLVWQASQAMLDEHSVMLRPASETVVFLGRPAAAGHHHVTASSDLGAATIFADILAMSIDSLPIGGTASPVANALLQVLFECAFPAVEMGTGSVEALVKNALDALTSCASEIMRPDSEFGAMFERLSLEYMAAHVDADGLTTAQHVLGANRLVRFIAQRAVLVKIVQVSQYTSEVLAGLELDPSGLSLQMRGQPPALGVWEADCTDPLVDSDRLFRNLALQDEFADTSLDLWQFPEWESAAAVAVHPLVDCTPEDRLRLAVLLPDDWADRSAAAIVADIIRALDGLPPEHHSLGLGVGSLPAGAAWLHSIDSNSTQSSGNAAEITLNRLDAPFQFPNSTDQWVGCYGSIAATNYNLQSGFTTMDFAFGLRDHTPEGLRVDLTIATDGVEVFRSRAVPGEVISRTQIDLTAVEQLTVAAWTEDDCTVSTTAYGAFLDTWVS